MFGCHPSQTGHVEDSNRLLLSLYCFERHSGTAAHAAVFEEIVRPGRSGPNGHLTVRFDGDLPEGGVEDLFFVTATDTKLLARRLGINIFEYFAGRGIVLLVGSLILAIIKGRRTAGFIWRCAGSKSASYVTVSPFFG